MLQRVLLMASIYVMPALERDLRGSIVSDA